MKVLKFGGSSVRNPEAIRRVLDIVRESLAEAPVLVASAMGKTTDKLVETARLAETGRRDDAVALVDEMERSHVSAVRELAASEETDAVVECITGLLDELRGLVHGISLIRECSPRSRDAVLSFGERMSTTIIAAAGRGVAIDTELVDARSLIRTDTTFNAASPDYEETARLVSASLRPEAGRLIVTQGFIGSAPSGVTTTLGRGGSDFSATILASAVDADAVEIWTDVDGIMSADPRVIDGARTIPAISYDEAAELAYFGAKVVHPYTILPAVRKSIPVWVRNTSRPESPGTRIAAETDSAGVRAVASKGGITLVTIQSSRMLNAYGFLRAIFEIFDHHRVPVDLVATSEVSVSMTVDSDADLTALHTDLAELGSIDIQEDVSIICIVGRALFREPHFVSRALAAVSPARIRMISFGSSEINLSLVVDNSDTQAVLKRLHESLWSA